ncbi:MAG: hypothetical protein KJ607_00710 [Bacteroidetes bacterium]|nr:hypothetical protein [Bacteroidota bacterium]
MLSTSDRITSSTKINCQKSREEQRKTYGEFFNVFNGYQCRFGGDGAHPLIAEVNALDFEERLCH